MNHQEHNQYIPRLHVDDSTVSVADDGAGTVLQDRIHVQPNMLAIGITTNEVRSMNEYGIDLDGIAWLGAKEAILRSEWDNGKWTAFGDTANRECWVEDDL